MAKYCKLLFYPMLIAIAITSITFTGCTEVDDTLGYGLIPDEQKMRFAKHTMSHGGIETYNRMYDSLSTASMNKMMIGNTISDDFGTITCGFLAQFTFNDIEWYDTVKAVNTWKNFTDKEIKKRMDEGLFYGYNAIEYDPEISLVLHISNIMGDNTVEQKFYIYEIVEPLGPQYTYNEKYPNANFVKKEPFTYFSSLDPAEYVDLDKPLFSFIMQNESLSASGYGAEKKLTVEEAGKEFMRKLVTLEEIKVPENPSPTEDEIRRGAMYNDSDIFKKNIKGFYIAPADNSLDAAIYQMTISESTYFHDTFLRVNTCSRKEDPSTSTNKELDSLRITYDFVDDFSSVSFPNVNVNTIKHNYDNSIVDPSTFYEESKGDANEKTSLMQIQGMLGVGGYIEFNDKFVAELKSLLTDENGDEWGAMMINKAIMKIWLDNDDVPYLNAAPNRLGMYYSLKGDKRFSFQRLMTQTDYKVNDVIIKSKEYMPVGIPDYPYQYDGSYNLTYGGYLVRSEGHGYYEMNISSLISSLVNYDNQPADYKENNPFNPGVCIAPALTTLYVTSNGNTAADPYSIFTLGEVSLRNDPVVEGVEDTEQTKRIEVELAYTLLKPKNKVD